MHQQFRAKEQDKKFTNTKADVDDKQAIKEEIVDEVEDLTAVKKPSDLNENDAAQVSGGISSSGANAIDHSIDTLQLDQYDYVEEVRLS